MSIVLPVHNFSPAQVAKQCGVTSQTIRDAVKAKKIEAWPVGESLLIYKDQGAPIRKDADPENAAGW